MPTMLRLPGKAKKIAYSIIGEPLNIQQHKPIVSKKNNKRLFFEETSRVR